MTCPSHPKRFITFSIATIAQVATVARIATIATLLLFGSNLPSVALAAIPATSSTARFNALAPAAPPTPDSVSRPDPARLESEIKAFSDWDSRNRSPRPSILFVGSSSIRIWRTATSFPDKPVVNRGFGGSHIPDVLHYYERLFAPHDPALIVLYMGENDVASGMPVDEVEKDYLQLLSRIQADYPKAEILYLSIKASSSRWQDWPRMNEFNQRVKALHQSRPGFHYADVATSLQGADGRPDDSLFLNDRLHLNPDGYARWQKVVGKALDEILTQ